MCCSVVQYVVVRCSMLPCGAVVAVCFLMGHGLHLDLCLTASGMCVAGCCSVLQCVAVCCSVLQCEAE